MSSGNSHRETGKGSVREFTNRLQRRRSTLEKEEKKPGKSIFGFNLSFKICIVATNVGEVSEVPGGGRYGKLIPPGNTKDLADALEEIQCKSLGSGLAISHRRKKHFLIRGLRVE